VILFKKTISNYFFIKSIPLIKNKIKRINYKCSVASVVKIKTIYLL
jgi:hypothetical protein